MVPTTLIFAVPRGFEDVCALDIARSLRADVEELDITHVLGTNFVKLRCPTADLARRCLARYDSGSLWSVTRCIVASTSSDVVIPPDLLDNLVKERQALPSKRSRTRKATSEDEPVHRGKTKRHVQPLSPEQSQTTIAETAFLKLLTECLTKHQSTFNDSLKLWHSHYYPDGKSTYRSFACHFERNDQLFPTLHNQDVSRVLGEACGQLLATFRGDANFKADLTKPDLHFVIDTIRNTDSGDVEALFGIEMRSPDASSTHRGQYRASGRTSLHSARAYALCLLHPAFQPGDTSRMHGHVFLDPCSGTGSIPLELAAISRRDGRSLTVLAADIELPSLTKGNDKFRNASQCSGKGSAGIDNGILWSGLGSGGFRCGMIDGIVSDLPWGHRELTKSAVARLYPKLLRSLGEATKDGGFAVFILWLDGVFLQALKASATMWNIMHRRNINVEGMSVYAYVLQRRPRSL